MDSIYPPTGGWIKLVPDKREGPAVVLMTTGKGHCFMCDTKFETGIEEHAKICGPAHNWTPMPGVAERVDKEKELRKGPPLWETV